MASERQLSYAEALREAFVIALSRDPRVFLIGEGVPDPKGIFATTSGLAEQFGAQRVRDMPLSENGMTGICIGAALAGMRPVLMHQRLDFALLSLDQIINHAAKWRYMFAGRAHVPLVIRLIIGRGWGQGPQHAQALVALFAQIPGLKVVTPATPYDARALMLAAIADADPTIYIEHRWLHNIRDTVPEAVAIEPLQGGRVARQGQDITVVTYSYMLLEVHAAAAALAVAGVAVEVIDLRVIRPLDVALIVASVTKCGHLLVVDTGHGDFGVAAEVIAAVTIAAFTALQSAPARLGLPPHPCPTAPALSRDYYPDAAAVVTAIAQQLVLPQAVQQQALSLLQRGDHPHDTPYRGFNGPF
ncbi:MAG: alpha-ketoacid dehydrogenase subunit beta [Gammaproteobacteria bacterium]|nr:alpha-ketoacid dehydrogenase subunit beta [Gammaproteobacteria bacterium]